MGNNPFTRHFINDDYDLFVIHVQFVLVAEWFAYQRIRCSASSEGGERTRKEMLKSVNWKDGARSRRDKESSSHDLEETTSCELWTEGDAVTVLHGDPVCRRM
jgi:hypothetical protein